MITNSFTTIILTAENGNYLTQVADVDVKDRIVAREIALGKYDSPENWKEISEEEADAYKNLIDE